MTSTAMAISKISGKVVDPGQLDAYLDKNGGYAGDGIYWDKAAQMVGLNAKDHGRAGDVLRRSLAPGPGLPAHPAHRAGAPATGSATYTVRSGDTLGKIAQMYGTTVNALVAANGISNPNVIQVGQKLLIPGAASPVTSPGSGSAVSGGISVKQLREIMPNLTQGKADLYLPHLNAAMKEAQINTRLRMAAFSAQLAHESAEFLYMEEIADGSAYEGRQDLGNTQKGDGKRYKGRGPIQLTGRANYRSAGKALGIDLENNPTRAAEPDVGFRTAAWYWTTRGLNTYADAGDFDTITRRINGGTNGKASRDKYYARALKVLEKTMPTS